MKIGIKKTILFSLIVTGFFSCRKSDITSVIKPLDNSASQFSISILSTTPLSNVPQAFIGEITSITAHGDYFYILDTYKTNSVSIFSNNGEFIFRTTKGSGPGEVIYPFSIFFKDDQLIIVERGSLKHYTDRGEFLFQENFPHAIFARNIYYLKNGNVLTYGSSPKLGVDTDGDLAGLEFFRYHLFNKNFDKEINQFFPVGIDYTALECDKPVSFHKGNVLLLSQPNNSIYRFTGSEVFEKYIIDFDAFNFTESDIKQGKFTLTKLIHDRQRLGIIDNIIETNQYIIFSYVGWNKGENEFVVYSKQKKRSANLKNILKQKGFPFMTPIGVIDNNVICVFKPYEFTNEQLSQYTTETFFPKGIDVDSNLILFVIKINEI